MQMTPRWLNEATVRLAHFRLLFIVLINLIPIGGVLLLGWDGGQILFFYWFENLAIGLVTLPRVIAARSFVLDPGARNPNPSPGIGCFFVLHYGLLCLVHGAFTLILATEFFLRNHPDPNAPADPPFNAAFMTGLAVMFGLHVIALVRDWWLPRRWMTDHPVVEMVRPYGRLLVLHISVMGGAWVMNRFDAPEWAVLMLCLGKAGLELLTVWIGETGIEEKIRAAPVK